MQFESNNITHEKVTRMHCGMMSKWALLRSTPVQQELETYVSTDNEGAE